VALQQPINSNSLDLVVDELANTVQQATNVFETFLAERHDLELLRQCEADLRQIGGTLRLLQIPGAALLADEMRNLCVAAAEDDGSNIETKLNVLSTAFFVLPRYLEFIHHRSEDIPLLAISHANELRAAHDQMLLPDSYFNQNDNWLFSRDSKLVLRNKALTGGDFDTAVKPIRQLYQSGLLGLLRDAQPQMQLTLMARALRRLCNVVPPGASQRFWLLAAAVLEAFANEGLEISPTRKRILSGLEGLLRNTRSDGMRSNEVIERELIFLLLISAYREGLAGKLIGACKLTPHSVTDVDLRDLRQQMLGISYETVSSVLGELRNELRHAKDILELIAQHGRSDEEELRPLAEVLQQSADVMQVLNLPSLAAVLGEHAQKFQSLIGQDLAKHRNELESLAETLLFVESSLAQIDRRKLNYEDLADLSLAKRDSINADNLVNEARSLVIEEAKAVVSMVKRALASYLESGFDISHIVNVPQSLDSVRGALQLMQLNKAAAISVSAVAFVKSFLKRNELNAETDVRSMEVLADAMISIEYYLNDLGRHFIGDEKILKIAEDSLVALGYAPDVAALGEQGSSA
jgi:hypothetical protein